MKKQTTIKIISRLIIFVFVVSIFQFTLPIQAATDTSMANLYSNPNQSGDNTYKFKISDVVSSGLLTNVVGCTGVVNKVATWMTKFIQSPKKQLEMADAKIQQIRAQLESACLSTKAVSEAAGDSIPIIGGLSTSIDTIFSKIKVNVSKILDTVGKVTSLGLQSSNKGKTSEQICVEQVKTISPEQLDIMIKDAEKQDEIALKEQCFDGIAITLAKNQLTSMTRSMMNWVNSGYGGNPFFVQNMQDFTYNLERNVVETGIDILLSPGNQNPYAYDFSRSVITGRGLLSGSSNFLGGLQSDLEAFIVSPQSYYSDDQLDQAMNTEEALLRAQRANYEFANDFSSGGWNGWLALTQRDQNNPLGFTMLASQYLADTQMQKVTEAKDELAQNDGFMSQKTCIKWVKYNIDGPIYLTTELKNMGVFETSPTKTSTYDQCASDGWKIITPGSIIKEKTTNYLNSPERQLELAKTINDSLNALFSILLSKLEGGGLLGLSDSVTSSQMNWTDTTNDFASPDGNTPYSNDGAYDGFNLTRDLGNNYIYTTPRSLGTWNAATNLTNGGKKLYPDLAPEVSEGENSNNTYYTVSTAGNTKLINEGYNGWAKGDRAFWDGSNWQNWKVGQANPIEKRGVVQIQQDYIVAAKEILGVLPNVMPKLGELDYCIPGPNPSYKTNSTDAQSAYQDWIGSMYVGPKDANREEWRIDHEHTRTYDNLKAIFVDNPNTWTAVLNSSLMIPLNGFDRNWLNTRDEGTLAGKFFHAIGMNDDGAGKEGDCVVTETNVFGKAMSTPGDCPNYHWHKDGKSLSSDDQADIDNRKTLMDETLDFVNNHLFQDFYKVFDEKMNKIYFSTMTNKYFDNEVSVGEIPNPGYILMAESGLDLTKNILYYSNDITKATQDYTDAIAQAKINIAKLEPIKTEVSGIIKTAQDRRNKDLAAKLGLSSSEIQTKYATCFAEEDIKFYDADTITNMGSYDTERCDDGIDNDLNGLVDIKDPFCPGYVAPRRD